MAPPQLSPPIHTISNVRLHNLDPNSTPTTHDLTISHHHQTLQSITPHSPSPSPSTTRTTTPSSPRPPGKEKEPPLTLPTLTHPHIHLDKAYIHNSPNNTHLHPETGTFHEALTLTTTAKKAFTTPDLHARGSQLLAESLSAGVTALRAFAEVDHTVAHTTLTTAITLKQAWADTLQIQLVAFAQDPLFSTEHGTVNRELLDSALEIYPEIDVIGSTPYVEADIESAKRNIDWAIARALDLDKHVDFHLDYNLDPGAEPLIWYVLRALREQGWNGRAKGGKRVMVGHCTRLTLFGDGEWERLGREIGSGGERLPVSFVGLPSSDLYMACPPPGGSSSLAGEGGDRVRGTLRVPELIRKYGLDVVMGVNNVGNAFTPWGSADPLTLACLGVGVYQAGTRGDAELLYECVSTRARAAIGLGGGEGLRVKEGERADLLLFFDVDESGCGISMPRRSVAEVVWDPPGRISRAVVVGGRLKRGRWDPWGDSVFGFA
ncbi:hypothetical protein BDV29DRAFT_199658 [Aspergillus leporis]|uniref:Metallo-dependent hydrolase n=1 Tax=Aspergillus leporis TaxID=41062 RepID=A0A5N5WHW5_9EURO|nr:hypothetical protein BDV29DRAFT_199658 [Aspergillus leporis]